MNVWDRRFREGARDPLIEAYNASIEEDRFLAAAEVRASAAYARALCAAGVIDEGERDGILAGLEAVGARIAGGEDLSRFEDIHSAVELLLTESIGEAGRKLHTGRSRNEQVAVDERLYLRERLPAAVDAVRAIQAGVIRMAEAFPDVHMTGYTHMQPAQPVLFAHYIMSLFWPLERAKERLGNALCRAEAMPLGSGALAGSTTALDREAMRSELGFEALSENSMDAVADRTYILDALFAFAVLLLDLSRFAADWIIYAAPEFGVLELDDAITTSSSLMPQKKNPDVFELIRSASGAAAGRLMELMMVVKGLPSTYNKDLQADKRPLREGVEEPIRVLKVFAASIVRMRPRRSGEGGPSIDPAILATDLVDYLVDRKVPFREAHGIIGEAGSGKSTLVQHFNGLLKPSSGRVLIEGMDLSFPGLSWNELRRHVGLVFQYPEQQLFEETVFDDISFVLRQRKVFSAA
ncbi:MAG: argininosuccinate lyase, partial [Candidatus Aminicenantales bacterium]